MHIQMGKNFVCISITARQRNAKAVRHFPGEDVAWLHMALTHSAGRDDTMRMIRHGHVPP